MRRLLLAAFLLAGCGKKSPPGAGPAVPLAPEVAPTPVAAPAGVDPESPLQAADLIAAGFPKDVRIVRFGANPRSKEFQCVSDTYPVLLFFAVEERDTADAAATAYKGRRDARAAAGDPPLKDEDRYGQKSYSAGAEVVFLKGSQVVVVRAGPKPEAESKPDTLEKAVRGVAERLAK